MRPIATLFCVLSVVSLLSGVASAVPITVGNAGFEEDPNTTDPYPDPWDWSVGFSQVLPDQNYGAAQGPTPDGSTRVAFIGTGSSSVTLSQVLTTTAAANTIYTLTINASSYVDGVSRPITLTPVLLHANDDSPVGIGPAPASLALPSVTATWFEDVEFTWTTDGTEAGTEFLKIGFIVTQDGANPGSAFLDTVRLDAVLIPEPASLGLLGLGGLLMLRRRDAAGS